MSTFQSMPNGSVPEHSALATVFDGRKTLRDLLTSIQLVALYTLLANDNSDCYVAVRRGDAVCRTSADRMCIGSVIESAVAAIGGADGPLGRLAFLPRFYEGWRERSRWAAIRLLYSTDTTANQRRAAGTFRVLTARAGKRWTLHEQCPNGDIQLWVFGNDFLERSKWWKLLIQSLTDVGLEPEPQSIEIFPPRDSAVVGPAAPGSWDPQTGSCSNIIAAKLHGFWQPGGGK